MTGGVALVHVAGEGPARLRIGGRSPLALVRAALDAVRPALDVRVGEELRAALERAPGAPFVVLWDATWPLAGAACVERVVAELGAHEAAVVAAPVKATIKRSEGTVIIGGLPRERLVTVGGLRALRREAAERMVARGAGDVLAAGLDVSPVLDELAVVPVRDADDALVAERLLAGP